MGRRPTVRAAACSHRVMWSKRITRKSSANDSPVIRLSPARSSTRTRSSGCTRCRNSRPVRAGLADRLIRSGEQVRVSLATCHSRADPNPVVALSGVAHVDAGGVEEPSFGIDGGVPPNPFVATVAAQHPHRVPEPHLAVLHELLGGLGQLVAFVGVQELPPGNRFEFRCGPAEDLLVGLVEVPVVSVVVTHSEQEQG